MPSPQAKPQRRWFQFSLRTLLVVVTVVAVFAFAWMKAVEPYRLQREAMAAINRLGGSYKTEDATGWIRWLDKNAQDVVVVDLADCDKPDEYLPHLSRLPKLRTLVLGGHSVGDDQVAAIGQRASLRWLLLDSSMVSEKAMQALNDRLPDLLTHKSQRRAIAALGKVRQTNSDSGSWGWKTPVPPVWSGSGANETYFCNAPLSFVLGDKNATDDDLIWLAGLSNLRELSLQSPRVTGSIIARLEARPVLSMLSLKGASINDAVLSDVAKLHNLDWLDLSETAISDDGLAHLVVLKNLTSLNLRKTHISDKSVALLSQMGRLEHLGVGQTRMTQQGVEALKQRFPKCDVWPY